MIMNRGFGFLSAAGAYIFVFAPVGHAQTISVGSSQIGETPMYIGYDAGNYYPNSNTTAWAAYSGVNAFRIFAPASDVEPSESGLQSGSGIDSLSDFETREAELRADPTSSTYTNWSGYINSFQNVIIPGSDELNLNYALSGLQSLGVAPMLQMSRTPTSLATWGDEWDEWHFYYAMAYYAAAHYGVYQFEMFNEPDATNSSGTPAMAPGEWLQCMKLASNAVQAAIQDVDSEYGEKLVADLSGPVAAHATTSYAAYGQPAISTNNTDFAGNPTTTNVMGSYDIHRYGTSTSSFISDSTTLKAEMTADSPTHTALPIIYTEFNSMDTSSYASSSDTANTPSMFTGVADDVLAAMSVGVDGMYAFKFNQTLDPSVGGGAVEKTGFFYTDNSDSPYNTTGATLGAEVMRLVSRAFEDNRPTFGTSGTIANYNVATSYDPTSQNYYVMGVNQNTNSTAYTLNLSSWGIAPGSIVSVEEVSSLRHGEVTQLITVPANDQIAVDQPSQSVWLLTVPAGPAVKPVTLTPTQDAQVRNGAAYENQTDPNDPYSRVGRSATDTTGDFVTYMQFNLGSIAPSSINRAILQVTGQVLSGAPITFHVYALTGSANNWNASTLDWENAPDLDGAADSQLLGVGENAFPVGSLTYTADSSETGLDVTQFLQQHPESDITFVMIREQQFAGDVDTSYVRLDTDESTAPPTLMLFTAVPEPSAGLWLILPAAALLQRRKAL